jgi:topoisomerase-4 subunit A
VIGIHFVKPRGGDELPVKEIDVEEFISIKGYKALGNQLTTTKIKEVDLIESLPYEIEEPTIVEEVDVNDPEDVSDGEQPQTKLDF